MFRLQTHCFREFAARLHDPQAQRDDLGGEEEVNYLLLIRLQPNRIF